MKKIHHRILGFILSVVMLLSVGSVAAFAEDYSFTYFFANEAMTEIYITGFKGLVPDNGVVIIPDAINNYEVIGIAEYAFKNLEELEGVVIPDDLAYVDENAFYGCGPVEVVYKSDYDEDGFDSSDTFEDHEMDFIISGTTLVGYKGEDTIVAIPYNCTAIADGAFKNNTKITAVYFERDLKKIGESAFEGCTNLEVVSAGNGVGTLEIGKNAFKDTPWLNNYPGAYVVLGTTFVKYKGAAESISVPNVMTAIAGGAFAFDDLTTDLAYKVKVPMTVEVFGEDCFYLYDSITPVYSNVVVYSGSAAETYCEDNGIAYTVAALPGDTDNNGKVTAADARYVLRVSAKLEKPVSDMDILAVADISGNNKIAAEDARLILRIAAGLDNYSAEELLSMPRTDYELLLYAANTISLAKAYGCSYSMFSYQEMTTVDMNLNSKTYFGKFEDELTPADKAATVTFSHDSKEAHDNLYDITLIDSEKVESFSCVIKDGSYRISFTLKDEVADMNDPDDNTFTRKAFPVEKASHYTNEVRGKYWSSNVKGSMMYRDCTLEMQVEIGTGMIQSMTYTMKYDFEISGKILGIGIKGSKGPATATRTDVIKYNNFSYFNI
ncbi:MAG: leucine-rich repeat protein [Clostridia bacterium]|nr:leucine-rich repeat protein [Clostridia bacterium]